MKQEQDREGKVKTTPLPIDKKPNETGTFSSYPEMISEMIQVKFEIIAQLHFVQFASSVNISPDDTSVTAVNIRSTFHIRKKSSRSRTAKF